MRPFRRRPRTRPGPAVRSATRSGRWRLLAALAGLFALTIVLTPNATAQDQARPQAARAFSTAELAAAGDTLLNSHITGTAWAVDQQSGRVRVMVDESVSRAEIAKLKHAAGDLAGALLIERTQGHLEPRGPLPGQATFDLRWVPCTLGFNVRIGTAYYWLTAGHCYDIGRILYEKTWPPDDPNPPDPLGQIVGNSFPGNDFGIARYSTTPTDTQGVVYLHNGTVQDITAAANPTLGLRACASGSTTGVRCGQVNGLNYTVSSANGTLTGMIRTNICSEPGDSGGPLYAGSTGLGLTSIGSGNCTSGGTTFFQPLVKALNAYGARVY
ncbi:S1 family peptidase [Streptomyces sp. 35G-GA-8]|uniref:S1 family peptidase n=1 Tax=Streptomyces sp. 35G-GA-8 TaxID=2939434 RepID=UPI0035B49505